MSLTTSSNGFSSSLEASGFLSSFLAAVLGRGLDLSCSAPFSAAISAGRARLALNSKADNLNLVGRFIALGRVEDARFVFPTNGRIPEERRGNSGVQSGNTATS